MRRLTFLGLTAGALASAASVASALTDADLLDKKFIHARTFDGAGRGEWARDDREIEGVFGVGGADAKTLYRWLRAAPATRQPLRGSLFSDENNYRELRRSSLCEAYSVGFPVDEIPWDQDRHKIREASPLVFMTIESDRFAIDATRSRRMLSLGTDLMDDVYYDTPDWILLSNGFSIRQRKRWDSPTEARRVLIGLKRDGETDGSGLKSVSKTDVRNDGASPEELAQLDDAIRTGFTTWGGSRAPAVPVRELHERLAARGVLPSTASYKDVLELEPRLFVRSIRSRYHLNECSLQAIQQLHALGQERLKAIAALAAEARAQGAIAADREASIQAVEKKIAGILDRTLVADKARDRLAALGLAAATADSVAPLLPTASPVGAPSTLEDLSDRKVELERRRVVAEAVSELYHEAANLIEGGDGLTGSISGITNPQSPRRVLTRSIDTALEPHVEWFVEWLKSKDARTWGPKTTMDPFVAAHAQLSTQPAEVAAYAAFGEQRRASGAGKWRAFAALDAAGFAALRAQLRNEQVRIWSRQIEAAGTAARGLWFDQARAFYVPGSYRQTSNFIIDTTDFTSMYTADAATVTDAAGNKKAVDASMEVDESKLVHCVLVNEGQIELTAVGAYTARLDLLGNAHERARTFVRWASAAGLAQDAQGWRDLHGKLAQKPAAELAADVAALNSFAKAQNARPIEAKDLLEVPPRLFTTAVRDGATDPVVATALDGARFVLDQYRDFLKQIAKAKEKKILDVLKAAREPGAPEPALVWQPTQGGKGETGLALLRARAGDPSLASADNHAIKKAVPIQRQATYTQLAIGPNERDWYRLDLAANAPVTFTIRFQNGAGAGDLSLHLYTAAPGGAPAQQVAASAGTGDSETITWSSPVARTVYLRVRGAKPTVASGYTLEVR